MTGLELVEATATEAPATATCPFGKVVVGAGGRFTGNSTGQVSFRNIRPSADLTSVSVQGLEDENGTVSVWDAHALAICASPIPGLERLAVTSASTSANKSVTATCPAGKALLGVGGEIAGGAGQVALREMIPGGGNGATATGAEDENGFAGSWSVTAYAICANPVAGLERMVSVSGPSSVDKEITATCSAGKQVLSIGGGVSGGAGMLIEDMRPNSALTNATVVGVEDEDGTNFFWSVQAYAICAATAQRVTASNTTATVPKTKTATCPAGTTVTGGGGEVTSGGRQVLLNEMLPTASGFRASGDYFEANPPPPWVTRWQLRAYAICTTPLSGRQVVIAESPLASSSGHAVVDAVCPAGKRVVGGGARVGGGQGDVMLAEITPSPELLSVKARAYRREGPPLGFDWRVYAYAVCAIQPAGLELVEVTEAAGFEDSVSVTATCPSGKHLLGAGGTINGSHGQVLLDDLRPNSSLTSVAVTGLEDTDGAAHLWSVHAHAICASP